MITKQDILRKRCEAQKLLNEFDKKFEEGEAIVSHFKLGQVTGLLLELVNLIGEYNYGKFVESLQVLQHGVKGGGVMK